MLVLLGLPPFAMFASELSIARAMADTRLAWVLALVLLLIVLAFAALVRNSGHILLGATGNRVAASWGAGDGRRGNAGRGGGMLRVGCYRRSA